MESAVQCDAETAELRTQLDNALTDATAAGKAAAAQEEQIRNLQQDRAVLEAELELVRSRTADLSETLSHERQQISEDRAEWATELKQLRRVIERRTAVASATLVTPPVRAASTGGGDKELVTVCDSRADPIVGSVLAQFDKIRQQRAAGRANRN